MPVHGTVSGSLGTPGATVVADLRSVTLGTVSEARFMLSGTYAGLSLLIEGSPDNTTWYPITAFREDNVQPDPQPIAPASNAVRSWLAWVEGWDYVRAKASGLSSGSVSVVIDFGAFFAGSMVQVAVPAPTTTPLAKLDLGTLVTKAAAGRNGAGAITVTGTTVGQRLVAVFGAPTAGGALEVRVPGTDFESVVSVAGQIQQLSAANLTANTYVFVLAPALV